LAGLLQAAGARHWRLVPGQLLRARQWGNEIVVYNDMSGDTHLVDAQTMDLLRQFQAGATLAADGDEPDDMLASLAKNFLIELVAC
jgi:hypothetical protein